MNETLQESISRFRKELDNVEYFDQTAAIVDETISDVEEIIYADEYPQDGGVGKSILLSLIMFRHLVKQLDAISEDMEELDGRTSD